MPREADALAGKGSFADRLRARREAIESGDPTGKGTWDQLAVDNVTDNVKITERDDSEEEEEEEDE